ncbi:hypothetical protein CCACVL1_08442 [Corchorus capsularis]|uniref:Uncharacterized protein n=1 Tax=Corchorus capsularis TaxID=210143 RepID=A0A1R3J0Q3_COCAP|nr:hypothetical protein CCACVL1_08442 [Corchorus capsularis]
MTDERNVNAYVREINENEKWNGSRRVSWRGISVISVSQGSDSKGQKRTNLGLKHFGRDPLRFGLM